MAERFEQPDFYMPFTWRISPHMERTREHVRRWARSVGLLDPEYTEPWPDRWSEAKFEQADFPLWTAMTHPDVTAEELNLVTDWHVTLWFVDDLFLPLYRRDNDRQAARRQVDRLLAFLPLDALGPVPYPDNPVERAFAELWPQTAPPMSLAWRHRFRRDIRRFLEGVLWELDHIDDERVADPIGYVQARREFGGLPMTSTLMEHALGEIPPAAYHTRPVQTALDAFADIISLHNDIVSYDREVAEGTVNNNGVHVLHQALGGDLHQAADTLNTMLTARVHTLEQMPDTELPRMYDDEQLPPPARAKITAYVHALQDATAGSYQWHTQTGRFTLAQPLTTPIPTRIPLGPTGIGTSTCHPAAIFGSR